MPRVPKSFCVNCNKQLDGAQSTTGEHTPSPKDFTVCMYCKCVMRFNDKLEAVILTRGDVEDILADPELASQLIRVGIALDKLGATRAARN